ncbi:structural cement protein Gp24 [Bordetella avium]|uniref:structural cement protein Gp24 n=2 Tax=Bordetella avium TaxID=521 RepID=UPI000E0CACE0|nr:hypothetical protein [Bordetella avium]UOK17009.1 hypothetical protein vBBaMIFTN1_07 [Bordetella phage vB_BaM-IFTN1]UOK17073.1 hypothetical protein vBBaMIFTN2_07 [Bordetella phage vB_BaM-IFTN2]UOK17136.1 hypothetical protein vBBaMIFTN3_07 [Bordetella phage vB_BaM-IFTN3]UOK17199.1 hypothetical protein vBBaMIFTN4_07 [Bordetella phage vB_BaM-IFTN4]UOK17271.1 hypothetical protein vBBaMIFTN5_07 [Bordetella phage vB_BaM-IFTN5]UOK17340.1 hypothetical protein vBBaMIFTN6_07 [Bordetella phage vB_BaM
MTIPYQARSVLISGLPGNLSHDGPTRAIAAVINSADESKNLFGRAFTHKAGTDTVQVGGAGVFAGILISPKTYAVDVAYARNASVGEFLSMGEVYVELANAGKVGDPVSFGADGTISAGTAGTQIPGAYIARHAPSAETPRLAVIALNGQVNAPA